MKKLALAALSALVMGNAFATVTVAEDKGGMIAEHAQFKVVRKILKKDEEMKKHDHPHANLVLTMVKGKVEFTFNDKDVIVAEAGKVITFSGDEFIAGKGLEDENTFVVALIHEGGEPPHAHKHEGHDHSHAHDHAAKPEEAPKK